MLTILCDKCGNILSKSEAIEKSGGYLDKIFSKQGIEFFYDVKWSDENNSDSVATSKHIKTFDLCKSCFDVLLNSFQKFLEDE